MLFKKLTILFLFTFFFIAALHAQKQFTVYDELPGIIKSYKPPYSKNFPVWGKMLYADSVNFKSIDALFKKEEGDGMEEKAEKETAIKRYYILWRKAVLPYTKNDGTIALPTTGDLARRQQFIQKQQSATQPATLMGNWTFAGPKETWWQNDGSIYTHNETPWQVNIYSFDVAPSNSDILYAGTETGFLNKTTDKGLHWQPVGVNYHFGGGITAVAIDPVNANIVYAAAGNQIHKSTDGGITWQAMLTGSTSFYADRIKIDKNNPAKLYAVAANGFYTSTNAGISWTQKWTNTSWDIELKPDNSNIVYVLTTRFVSGKDVYKVFISKDGGQTFVQDNNFSFYNEINTGGLLAVTPADPSLIFAAVLTDPQPKIYKGVYSNTAGTTTWSLKATGGSFQLPADNWQGYYDLVFDVSPTDVNTVYFGTSGLYKSVNGGASFKAIYDYGQPEVIPIHPDAQDMKLVNGQEGWVSTDGGLTYSTDAFSTGANAYARNNGIVGSDFWGFDQGWNEDLMVGGRYHNGNTAVGEFYSDKALRLGGAESPTGWIMPGQSRHAAFDDLGGGHILPSSLTAMEEGTFPFTKFPSMYYYGYRRSGFLIHPNYYNTFFIGNGTGVWKSTDGGSSFNLLHDFGKGVWQMQISRTNPNIMYADVEGDGLYRSADGGNTWVAKPALTQDPYGYDWWQGNLSMVVSPFNENVLYACPQQNWPDNSRKIFRSADGGDTWQDWTTATIHDYGTKWLAIQAMPGNKDGIYLFTNYSWDGTIGGKVFFRSEDMGDWTDYSNNYPADASIDFAAAMPFYRDGKLRAAGNMGIWETPLYEPDFPVAAINPMVDKSGAYGCARDTFYFDDYSVVNHAGAQWTWSFSPVPAYISDVHARNPKVVFANAGKYAVTETITQNGKTYSRTINDMVDISENICGIIDTVPGKAAYYDGAHASSIEPFNISTNNFTLQFWVKPEAAQSDWAGLLLSRPDKTVGLNITAGMELRYNWNGNEWWNATGLHLTANKWNHVAMVISPSTATVYLNGVAKSFNENHEVISFTESFYAGKDANFDNRYFKGQLDEICFFNRALTQNEIREQMHLVKNAAADNTLIHYYQFNENSGAVAYDKAGSNHLKTGGATYTTSTMPVGGGVSKRLTVNAAGSYTFDNTGVKISFPADTQPNGELCVTRINQQAQNGSSTNNGLLFGSYWIINNYGTSKTFTNLSSMGFDDCGAVTSSEIANPSLVKLFKRGSFDDASAGWLQVGMASQVLSAGSSSNISFVSPSVTSFSQFQLQRTDAVLALKTITLHAEMLNSKSIGITWETFGEEAIDNYTIERSTDGIHFTALGKQSAMNTSGTHKYHYVDANLVNGVLYYRIQVLHKNGSLSYSSIVNITVRQQFSLFEVYPNPLAKGQLLKTSVNTSQPYQLHIYNANGEEVYNQKHTGNAQIKLKNFPAGVYFYSAVWGNQLQNGRLIVQ